MQSPPAEHQLTLSDIRRLIAAQAPQWAQLPISYLSEGWDNCMYRLGTDLLLRLPRRTLGNECMQLEQRWLNEVTRALPIPTPRMLLAGQPASFYPYYWSITTFQSGEMAISVQLSDQEALRLAKFYQQLHQPAPSHAPHNPYRGVPLAERAEPVEARLDALLAQGLEIDILRRAWRAGMAAQSYTGPSRWLHGDSHPKNILVHEGKLSAILDWGDLTAGDPATDLAAFWMLFESKDSRQLALDQYEADHDMRLRARAWAALFATVLLDVGLKGDKLFAEVGDFTRQNLANDLP